MLVNRKAVNYNFIYSISWSGYNLGIKTGTINEFVRESAAEVDSLHVGKTVRLKEESVRLRFQELYRTRLAQSVAYVLYPDSPVICSITCLEMTNAIAFVISSVLLSVPCLCHDFIYATGHITEAPLEVLNFFPLAIGFS